MAASSLPLSWGSKFSAIRLGFVDLGDRRAALLHMRAQYGLCRRLAVGGSDPGDVGSSSLREFLPSRSKVIPPIGEHAWVRMRGPR